MKRALLFVALFWPVCAAAQYIDGLPPAASVSPSDLAIICQGGNGNAGTCTTKRATVTQVLGAAGNPYNLRTFCGAVGDGVADDSGALKKCINAVNTSYAAGTPAYISIPSGIFLIKSASGTMPAFAQHVPGAVIGAGTHKSYIQLDTSYVGDLFAWSEAWMGNNYTGPGFVPSQDMAGPLVSGITVTGNTTSASQQNAFRFYDRNDHVLFKDVDVFYLNGQCLAMGHTLAEPQAYMRESSFWNLKCWNTGTTSLPAVEISSTTPLSSDSTNELAFYDLNIFSSAGAGASISSPGVYAQTNGIKFYNLRSESNLYDAVDVGLSTDLGAVSGVDIYGLNVPAIATGRFGLKISAGGASQPYAINVFGANFQGSGGGVDIDNANLVYLNLANIAVSQAPVTYGPNSGANVVIDGAAATDGMSFNYSTSWPDPLEARVPFRTVGLPNSANRAGNAVMRVTTTGASAVRLTMDGAAANGQNCFNPVVTQSYNLSIQLNAQDATTASKFYQWALPVGYFSAWSGKASAYFQGGTPATTSNGTLTGIGVAVSADATNGCLNIAFTPPTANTDTWNVTVLITFVRSP